MILGVFIYFMIAVLLSLILHNKKGIPFAYWIQLTFFFPIAIGVLLFIFYYIFVR